MWIFLVSRLNLRTTKLIVLSFLFVLIFETSCDSNRNHSGTNSLTSPIKTLSGIRQDGNVIKIDTEVILNNKNLQPLIAELAKSSISSSYVVTDIPDFIKSFLEKVCTDHFSIANPGKNWNCCDGNWDENLPNRELDCLGKSNNLFFISYKTGGVGVAEHVILIEYHNNKITDFWTGTFLQILNNKDAIVKYLTANKNKEEGLNTNQIQI